MVVVEVESMVMVMVDGMRVVGEVYEGNGD